MNKTKMVALVNDFKKELTKHSPEILVGIGITGMVSSTVLAVKVTPKAIRLIDEKKKELDVDYLTKTEVVKTCWKCYIPSAVTAATSIACLIGASSVNAKRNAALAAAYTLSDTAFKEYKEKVIETIGEKKERTVKNKVAEERIKKNPVTKNEVYITEKGNTLCYDAISGRYFKGDIDKIKRAENTLNKQMLSEMYISLNDFYDELGLARTAIGDELGWKLDDGMIEFDFSSQIAEDGTPCLVVDYNISPKYGYSNFL